MTFREYLTETKIESDKDIPSYAQYIIDELKSNKVEPELIQIKGKNMSLSFKNTKNMNNAIKKLDKIMKNKQVAGFDYPTEEKEGFAFTIKMN